MVACFAVFKHGTTEEVAQLCFELIKMASFTPGSTINTEYISRDHVQGYIERFINQNEQMVHSFYAKTEFDPRLPIKREDFVAVFNKVKNLPMFTWVLDLVGGYNKKDCLNIDEGRSVDVMRRLTVI